MSREVLILWAGRHQRRGWDELCAEYRRRVRVRIPVRDQMVKVRRDGPGRLEAEGKALLAALPSPCWTIVLDVRGRPRSSEEFARELGRLRDEWPHPVAFLIGSDLGLDPRVHDAARDRLTLSPMTFGHELARLVLYEQLYRALCIDRGIKYHRGSF